MKLPNLADQMPNPSTERCGSI